MKLLSILFNVILTDLACTSGERHAGAHSEEGHRRRLLLRLPRPPHHRDARPGPAPHPRPHGSRKGEQKSI